MSMDGETGNLPRDGAESATAVRSWTQRIIMGDQMGLSTLPPWLDASYQRLRKDVMDPAYPCFFGTMAEKRGEMFYSYVEGKDISLLPATMHKFAELAKLPEFEKNNIAIFFEPDAVPLSHQQYHDLFWDALQYLHDNDPDPEADHQHPPSHPEWEFSFSEVEMFVVCACPSFEARHSRNLGPGMVLLFQPRSVFVDKVTNRVIGQQAREEVRRRLKKWDEIPAHPDLGFYGDPGNLEWKQYFLPDHNTPAAGACPFLSRATRRTDAAAAAGADAAQQAPAVAHLASHASAHDWIKELETQTEQMRAVSLKYASLPAEKRQAFRTRLMEQGVSPALLPIVPMASQPAFVPLSFAQERLWFLWKLEPQNPAYNVPGAVRLEGDLDVEAVKKALDYLVLRHASLRTRFAEVEGVAVQLSLEDAAYEWKVIDAGVGEDDRYRQEIRQLLKQLSLRSFDLESGPLLRVTLVRLGARHHLLHFVMHHIVSDGWSHDVLIKEFAVCYEAATKNMAPQLAPLSIQYADYALWQREWLDDRFLARQLDYWRERLGGEHAILELPHDRKRKGARSSIGGRVYRNLAPAIVEKIKAVAQRSDATVFMALLSVYALLLHRYSGQSSIRVGIPASGRSRLETEGLIGFFVNTLVIQSDIAGTQSFGDLLSHVRTRVLEAQSNQDLPFARLVDALQPERSMGHTPLFQAMFNHNNERKDSAALAGIRITGIESGEEEVTRFDLALNSSERQDGINLSFRYARDIFDQQTIERVADHYVSLLEQLVATPSARLATATLFNLVGGQALQRAQYGFHALPHRVALQAASRPAAPAVSCEGDALNYGQLDAWSNRIGRKLLSLGAATDECVGICVSRSCGMIAALLGIMKSGAAFVPLDPDYPAERLAYMIADANVSRVVVDRSSRQHLAGLAQKPALELVLIDEVEQESADALERSIHPEQLAYVIYTSGSTGQPKGVAISHRSLSLHMDDFVVSHAIAETDKVLHSSTINFDVALHEIFPALIRGGQVEIRGPQPWDLDTMSRRLVEEKVTFARIPTAYWRQWLSAPPPAEQVASLRQLTVGGEALPGDALRQWQNGPLAHIRVANLYGPTETTVACLYHDTVALDAESTIVPIGKPYPGRSAYVMDADGNEAPVGGLGDLWIGGPCVARGYLQRPDLTAERFVPDPFDSNGGRLYRSGDACRRRADGTVEYLGRRDQQVKLRGFRIELGEIESLLRTIQGVSDAIVEVRGDGEHQQLIAYVVGTAAEAEIREYLSGKLPAYMVPSAIVAMTRLPVLPSGKTDRKALPAPSAEAGGRATIQAPTNAREALYLAIWKEVLGRDDIGIHDNFFSLGGNSLSALRVAALSKARGIDDFKLEALFGKSTISALAANSASSTVGATSASVTEMAANFLPMNSMKAPARLFAIHPVYGLTLNYGPLAQAMDDVASVYGVQFPLHLPTASWPQDLKSLAAVYVETMRRIQPAGPYRLVAWSLGGLVAIEIAHQLEALGDTVDFIGIVDGKTQQERDKDRAGKNSSLRLQTSVAAGAIDEFWKEIAGWGPQWVAHFSAQENVDSLAQQVLLASNHIKYVVSAGIDRRVHAPLHVWWSSDVLAKSEAGKSMEWKSSSHASVTIADTIDARHKDVIAHADFIDGIRTAWASLSRSEGVK